MSEEKKDEMPSGPALIYAMFGYMVVLGIIAWPTQQIWNITMVDTFALPELSYMDSLRLLILVRLILPGTGVKV